MRSTCRWLFVTYLLVGPKDCALVTASACILLSRNNALIALRIQYLFEHQLILQNLNTPITMSSTSIASASWANTPSNNLKCHSPPIKDEDEDTSSMISTATLPELRQEPPIVQDCSFLNLPLEIRLKIFEYLLPHLWMDCGYSPYGTQGIRLGGSSNLPRSLNWCALRNKFTRKQK